jgi:hypothetical protein
MPHRHELLTLRCRRTAPRPDIRAPLHRLASTLQTANFENDWKAELPVWQLGRRLNPPTTTVTKPSEPTSSDPRRIDPFNFGCAARMSIAAPR